MNRLRWWLILHLPPTLLTPRMRKAREAYKTLSEWQNRG